MKKVVIFSLTGPDSNGVTGGLEVYLREFALALGKLGFQIEIYCGRDKDEKHLPNYEEISKQIVVRRFDSPFQFLPLAIFPMHAYYIKNARKNTDYVIENQSVIPLMTSFYKESICTIIHHLTGKDFIRKQGKIKGNIGLFLEGIVLPKLYKNKNILTVSNHTKKELIELGFETDLVSVIPPIVNSLNLSKEIYNNRSNIISYIGRYTGIGGNKRIDHIIEILPEIIKVVPDIKLIIGGSMKKQQVLDDLVKKYNLENYVQFKGFISDEEKKTILMKSKVFTSPSYQEGFGITYVEANSFGTPVVGYEIEGLDTVPDTAGTMVQKDDKKGLAEAVITLLTNNQNWEKISNGAIQNSKRFGKDKVVVQIQKYILMKMGMENEAKKITIE